MKSKSRINTINLDTEGLPWVFASEVPREKVKWMWKPYIPLGKLVGIDGDPDVGKTAFALKVAAHVTAGKPFPGQDEAFGPGNVVIMSGEDGW